MLMMLMPMLMLIMLAVITLVITLDSGRSSIRITNRKTELFLSVVDADAAVAEAEAEAAAVVAAVDDCWHTCMHVRHTPCSAARNAKCRTLEGAKNDEAWDCIM